MHQGVRDGPSICTMRYGPSMADHTETSGPAVPPACRKSYYLYVFGTYWRGNKDLFIQVIVHGDVRKYGNTACQACSVHGLFIDCRQLWCFGAVLCRRTVTAGYAAAAGEQYFSHGLQYRKRCLFCILQCTGIPRCDKQVSSLVQQPLLEATAGELCRGSSTAIQAFQCRS